MPSVAGGRVLLTVGNVGAMVYVRYVQRREGSAVAIALLRGIRLTMDVFE